MLIAAALRQRLSGMCAPRCSIDEIHQFVDRSDRAAARRFQPVAPRRAWGLKMFLYGGAQNYGIERFEAQLR